MFLRGGTEEKVADHLFYLALDYIYPTPKYIVPK